VFFLTSETTGSPVIDTLLPFLNLGVIVVIVLMVVTKTGLVPKWSLDDAQTQHDRELNDLKAQLAALKADNDKLADTMLSQAIPALTEANRLSAQWLDYQNRRTWGTP
jgi:hypothetical protein